MVQNVNTNHQCDQDYLSKLPSPKSVRFTHPIHHTRESDVHASSPYALLAETSTHAA